MRPVRRRATNVHPIAMRVDWGPFSQVLPSYGLMLIAGGCIAMLVHLRCARSRGIAFEDALFFGLVACAVGFLGAVVFDLLVRVGMDRTTGSNFGLTYYGGLLSGGSAAWWYVKRYSLPNSIWEGAVVAVPLGHAMGRIGCLFGGCCYGRVASKWGITFFDPAAPAFSLSQGAVPLHAVQLYETGGLVVLAGLLVLLLRLRWHPLRVVAALFGGYAVLRFAVEFWRADPSRGMWNGVSTSQWIAVVTGVLAIASVAHASLAATRPNT